MSVISAAAFVAALRRWGVEFIEHSRHDRCADQTVSWRDHEARRSYDCADRGWDAHGIVLHHTAGPTSWTYVWDGDIGGRGIPGPLYVVEIYEDGIAHLTGWGVSNNVGACDRTARDMVVAGEMPTSGGNVFPGGDDYNGANSEMYGIAYRGTGFNSAQRHTGLLVCAAICDAHGGDWDGGSIAAHMELTRRKPGDPGGDMSDFRRDVNDLLAAGPPGGDTMDWKDKIKSFVRPDGDETSENAVSKTRRDAFRLRQPLFYSGRHNDDNKYAQAAGVRDIDNPAYPGSEADPRPTSGDERKGASWRYALERIWRWSYWAYRRTVRVDERTDRIEAKLDGLIAAQEQRVQDAVEAALIEHDRRVVKVDVDVLAADAEEDSIADDVS